MKKISFLKENEYIVKEADIAHSYYSNIYGLYFISFFLLSISTELHIGIIGFVLLIRTIISNYKEIKNKRNYSCVVTNLRIIIFKGQSSLQEINPVSLKNVKTIFIKPFTFLHYFNLKNVGSLEILTKFDGRYVINHIKKPYEFHKHIISDVVIAK